MSVSIFRSVRFKIPLFILSGVIPLIIITFYYSSKQASQKIRQKAEANIALKAQLLTESINRWNDLNKKALLNLSAQPDLVNMNAAEQKIILKTLTENYQHVYLAMVVDKTGYSVARNDDKKQKYYGDRLYIKGGMKGDELRYQPIMSRTNGKPAVCMGVPIIKQATTEIVGAAAICSNLEAISQELGRLKFGKTGYGFLVDRSGTVLAHKDKEFTESNRLRDLSTYPPVKQFISGKIGHFSFYDYERIKWVSYTIPLSNDWGVVLVQQEADFLENERDFQNIALAIAAISVLGVIVLTAILGDRPINPIGNLAAATKAMARGEFDRRVIIKRKDELGVIANSFNSMAGLLKNSFKSLELLVERRTAQLKLAKDESDRAKIAAETANEAKDRFLFKISHELRTPLNAIMGYAKILQRNEKEQERILSLKIIEQSGTHLLDLINELLDFAKFKAGKMQLNPDRLELYPFLEAIAGTISMSATQKGIKFRSEFIGDLPDAITADGKRLRQVLLNLLSNAVKFTDRGEVILRVIGKNQFLSQFRSQQSTIRFEVIDTGVGISPSELEKIFQPFEQVGEADSRSTGTGLGLSVALELVELMGSRMQVKTELGSGSTFRFDVNFDIAESTPQKFQQQHDSKILGYYSHCQYKILVVDDLKENRMLLQNILAPLGFKVIEASDGESGLEVAKNFKPDLILTDLLMPKKSGLRMVLELRQMPYFKEIPIIGVSACNSEVMEYKSLCVGCNSFLSKPIDEKKLLDLLQNYLSLEWNSFSVAG